MATYYYLIASLPMLRNDGGLPFSYAQFLEMARGSVNASTFRRLEELTVDSCEGPLLKEWSEFYGKLMRELNYQRSVKLGRPAVSPDRDQMAVNAVAAAMAAKNPLEAERVLLGYEFAYLDSLVGMHSFDDHILFGYAIKLKLLERLCSFDHEEGKKEFKSLFDHVRKQVLSL